ncbi:uncharacterized protein AB675_5916 [Cyphellophora attinorum]|uniref:Zn(2)-C6 fungal-type domain-containing protein n=1 Tax=Cyphellophora attinorum TaxID=1664694 RepID=A0A0N0NL85_9EURO|nr:uncharacterized protein AB675_5916 [Phialophora attinorum]KPI38888.1 hypothetical protein AB675_5916 [Phialophora attinorum]
MNSPPILVYPQPPRPNSTGTLALSAVGRLPPAGRQADPLTAQTALPEWPSDDVDAPSCAGHQQRPLLPSEGLVSVSKGTSESRSLEQRYHKPRRIGQLTKEQRTKARDVRRKGACVRCRVLKKPCTGNTPCDVCVKLINSRFWTQPCRRDRLHEHCAIEAAVLKRAALELALEDDYETSTVRHSGHVQVSLGRIATPVNIHVAWIGEGCQARLVMMRHGKHGGASGIEDDMFDRYIREERSQLLELEQSSMMRKTIRLCLKLAERHGDDLLSLALQRWLASMLLVDKSITLDILSAKHSDADNQLGTDLSLALTSSLRAQVTRILANVVTSRSKELLRKLELRIYSAKKFVFETYLVTLLMLSVAERLVWWCRSVGEMPLVCSEDDTQELLAGGEALAELTDMMIKIRGVVPVLVPGPEGVLTTTSESSEDVKLWLNEIGLTRESLETMMDRPYLVDDHTSMDGRFWARSLYANIRTGLT